MTPSAVLAALLILAVGASSAFHKTKSAESTIKAAVVYIPNPQHHDMEAPQYPDTILEIPTTITWTPLYTAQRERPWRQQRFLTAGVMMLM